MSVPTSLVKKAFMLFCNPAKYPSFNVLTRGTLNSVKVNRGGTCGVNRSSITASASILSPSPCFSVPRWRWVEYVILHSASALCLEGRQLKVRLKQSSDSSQAFSKTIWIILWNHSVFCKGIVLCEIFRRITPKQYLAHISNILLSGTANA